MAIMRNVNFPIEEDSDSSPLLQQHHFHYKRRQLIAKTTVKHSQMSTELAIPKTQTWAAYGGKP